MRLKSGRIEPGESTEVSGELRDILHWRTALSAIATHEGGPTIFSECKDKFLVQSTMITPEKDQPGADLVSSPLDQYSIRFAYLEFQRTTVPDDDATKIHQQKLKGLRKASCRMKTKATRHQISLAC
jgi:hypothetical protein